MSSDVLITPSSGLIQFSSSAGSGSGQIKVDGDNLLISNVLGDVLLGDGASDVFIGDGTNNVDIVFEQNGEIRDDGSGKNIILGSKTTNLFLTGSTSVTLQEKNGNVGIGTTSADALLHISASLADQKYLLIENTAGTDIFVVTSSGDFGKVGIGTSAPQNPLSVSGSMTVFTNNNTSRITVGEADDSGISSNNIIAIEVDGANNKSHTFTVGTGNDYIIEALGSKGDVHLSPRRDIRFGINNGSAYNFTERMILTGSTGNLGIGTSTPPEKLTVAGNISASGGISSSAPITIAASGTNARLKIKDIGSSAAGVDSGVEFLNNADVLKGFVGEFDSNSQDIDLISVAGGLNFMSNNTDAMYINTSQRVGIGTTSPTKKLQVEGSISASGTASFGHFIGNGSGLTGVTSTVDIDGFDAFSGVPHATQDEFLISDNGTEKRATMTMVANGAFALVSGDATIAAGGALTNAAAQTNITSLLATDIKIGEDDETKIDFETADEIHFYANNAQEMVIQANVVAPGADDGTALGDADQRWSDLFLASGGVINFNNGDATITGDGSNLDLVHNQSSLEGGMRLTTFGDIIFANVTDGNLNFGTDVKLFISQSTGNVGIGDNVLQPAEKLTVEGNISSSGFLSIEGNVTASGRLTVGGVANFNGSFVNIGGGFGSTGVSIAADGDIQTNGTLTIDGAISASSDITASGNISSSGTLIAASADFNDGNITNVGTIDVDKIRADAATNVNIELVTSGIKFNAEAGDTFAFNDVYNNTDLQYFDANEDVIFTIDQSVPGVAIGALGGAPTEALDVEGNIQSSGNVVVAGSVIHKGDTNTSIAFTADAIAFNAGGVEMLKLTEAATNTIALGAAISTNITASGNISASGQLIAASADFKEGNISNVGTIDLDTIRGDGDTNTNIAFSGDDVITFKVGNEAVLTLTQGDGSLGDIVSVGDGGDVNFRVRTNGENNTIFVEGSSNNVGMGNSVPPEKLTVAGNISASGELNIDHRLFDTGSTTLNTVGGGMGDIVKFGGTTTIAGAIYQLKGPGTWEVTDADAAASATGSLAVALGTNATTNGMLLRGVVKLNHDPGGAVGAPLYLAVAAGSSSNAAPTGNNDIARIIGYNFDASGMIYFNPDNTFVEVSA